MRIDKVSIRNEYVEEQCDALCQKCMEHDGFKIHSFVKASEYDFELPESENPFVYLMYDDSDNLIAYLGYVKINKTNLEVCMAVDPEFRRQKIGTNLFLRLVSEFDSCSYQVSLDPKNDTGKAFLEKLGFEYTSTEMAMSLSKDDFYFNCEPIELHIEADDSIEGFDNLLKITGVIGVEKEDSSEPSIEEIGWLYLAKEDSCFSLFDIEVNEKYREQGYGNRILQTTIRDAFKQVDKIILHVSTNNTPAIKLYEKTNFKTIDTIDCYEL
ncbi:MAG: GNAT family N-acetyltransferase [Eubacterium sp.]|nr:GNAT family N-acetyltransferase [Eubacterium sp.]